MEKGDTCRQNNNNRIHEPESYAILYKNKTHKHVFSLLRETKERTLYWLDLLDSLRLSYLYKSAHESGNYTENMKLSRTAILKIHDGTQSLNWA